MNHIDMIFKDCIAVSTSALEARHGATKEIRAQSVIQMLQRERCPPMKQPEFGV